MGDQVMFTVKSAYHLALELEKGDRCQEGYSDRADGSRVLYKEIQAAQVPSKVRIFAWKLSQEGLATHCNRKRRTLSADATWQICGTEEESGYHAVIRCTGAVALHHEIRSHWLLPEQQQFRYTGPEWFLPLGNAECSEC
jgi:hypothetical protein